jgi:hypothetical protein
MASRTFDFRSGSFGSDSSPAVAGAVKRDDDESAEALWLEFDGQLGEGHGQEYKPQRKSSGESTGVQEAPAVMLSPVLIAVAGRE